MRRVVVGFSGGVSSAWCAKWALEHFPREEVVFLHHDTKEEDEDTYRFIREWAAYLSVEVTERSDGRSVSEVFEDEGMLANNRAAFCSRILKAEQKERYFQELREVGVTEIISVLGFSAIEWKRVQRATAHADAGGYTVRFPMIEEDVGKQQAADEIMTTGIALPSMYRWSEHANCRGCARAGMAYWLAVHENDPEAFERRADQEDRFGHTFLMEGPRHNRRPLSLRELVKRGLKRAVKQREAIDIGPCECGD